MRAHVRTIGRWVMLPLILLALAGCNLPTPTPSVLPTSTQPTATETLTAAPTLAAATDTPTPPPADTVTPTIANPVAIRDTLCYGGPGRVYGVISGIQAGRSLTLLGKSALLDWWIVQNPIYNVPCWVAAADLQIDLSFDTSSVEIATPPPYPANLLPGSATLDPSTPTCAVQFTVYLNVKNNGSQATITQGKVSAVDMRASDGSQQASGTGSFPTLDPGDSYQVQIPLTVSAYYGEQHNIKLVIDPDRQIPEFNETDNSKTISYTLEQGSCP